MARKMVDSCVGSVQVITRVVGLRTSPLCHTPARPQLSLHPPHRATSTLITPHTSSTLITHPTTQPQQSRRSVSDMRSTPSPCVQAKPKVDTPGGPDSVKGRIYGEDKDMASASARMNLATINAIQLRKLTESRIERMFAFGVGAVLLGVGGVILTIYYCDISRAERMRVHFENIGNNPEKALVSQINNLERSPHRSLTT
ncbi:hypothetical protein B9Z19DRAFT_1110953 [Tuber borchii]|uniref:Uncharacterized protein n=1 Tax=Tuber borchii TaxID=42251 RepID=A0A2T6ZEP8_TUBBO|nr:hypothetical protein B9Z19DRAFT_1110953 [Tuber borchii]